MGGWFSFAAVPPPTATKASELSEAIAKMKTDFTHCKLTTNLLRQEVVATFAQHGRDNPTFIATVGKLRRATMKQSTTANVLNQLEEAKHAAEMMDMTNRAMKLLGKGKAGVVPESAFEQADDYAALAEEQRARQEDLYTALAPSESDLEEFISGLNLEKASTDPKSQGGGELELAEVPPLPAAPTAALHVTPAEEAKPWVEVPI